MRIKLISGLLTATLERAASELLSHAPQKGALPIMECLANAKQYINTTRYIFDTGDPLTYAFENAKIAFNHTDSDDPADYERLKQRLDALSKAFRLSVELNCKKTRTDRVETQISDKTTLVIPLGSVKMLRSWLLMQSILHNTAIPKSIIFVTGLDPQHDRYMRFKVLHHYISKTFRSSLPEEVDIRWAVYDNAGNAGVSRAIGGKLTKTEFVFYHDADDVLGGISTEVRLKIFAEHPEVDHILGYGHSLNSEGDRVHSLDEYLGADAAREAMVDDLVALDDITKAFCHTFDDFEKQSQITDMEKEVEEVMSSFDYRGQIDLNTIENWPQLRWYDKCEDALNRIKEAESQQTLSEIASLAESKAVSWFKNSCREVDVQPQYVKGCLNGWGAIRAHVFGKIPIIYPNWGEDSLLTFMVSHSNHTSICHRAFSQGVYVAYRRDVTRALYSRLSPDIK